MVSFGGYDAAVARPRMEAALRRLTKRGPDGNGEWADDACLLGHRRLSIVDLSDAGRQPMLRGPLAIVFNGMIYNYREIRRELEARGERFVSDTDTEVILAGWAAWGPDLLPRLNGMFAFGIWDSAARKLWLVRDRFGKKPLAWKKTPGGAIFATEHVALQLLDGRRGAVDPTALAAYLTLKYVPEPMSILAGFGKVAPGHYVEIDANGSRAIRWYRAGPDPEAARLAPADRAAYIRDLIERATRERLVADVPVGAFLSGGLDSGVVAFAAGKGLHTFTIGFDGVADYYEERPRARATAKAIGSEHVEMAISADAAMDAFAAVFDGLDEPFGDSSAVPTYLVSRAMREHATVALSGDGGDEVFGGYRRHQGERLAARYGRLPAALRRALEPLVRALPESKETRLLEFFRRSKRFVAAASLDEDARQLAWMQALDPDEVDALLGRLSPFDAAALVHDARHEAPSPDPVSRTLYADLMVGLPGDMLVKLDRMGMASALEVRSPLIDHRVVEAALALPAEAKVAPREGKRILREAFAGHLPDEVLHGPKKGFEIPVARWLLGPWRGIAEAATNPAVLGDLGLRDTGLGRRWLDELAAGRRDTAERIWVLVALREWTRRQGEIGAV